MKLAAMFVLVLSACSDKVPPLPQAEIDTRYSNEEHALLNSAVYRLDGRCYNVFSKPAEYRGLSARFVDAAPEEKNAYGWDRVAEISFTLSNHRDFGAAIKHSCSFRIGDGVRAGINGKSTCMESACRMQPLENGAAWGVFSPE